VATRAVRISVVIPSYNSSRYIAQAIGSALTQEPPPHEIIVQDGASTDASLDLLRTFGDRVRWESRPDTGQAQALNRAVSRVTGDVVVWLNADDLLVPGAFAAAQVAFGESPNADFAYGNYDMIRDDGSILRRFESSAYDPDRVFFRGCYIFSGAIFFRRSLLERVGAFDESLHACMDLDYLLRIGQARAVHLDRTVAQFRRSQSGKSSRIRGTFLREGHRVRRRAAGRSLKRRVLTFIADARDVVLLFTEPVRHTRVWSAFRPGKVL
jgi:glycosyltransferase involved in cell wall biosynthesis